MSIKGRQPDMRMSLRLRERGARRSRYLDMSLVSRIANEFAASGARSAKKPLFRLSPGRPGRTTVSPICEWA